MTTRADVHFVITEHGVAQLFGKNLRERAKALIAVAHPDFREDLSRAARERGILRERQPGSPWSRLARDALALLGNPRKRVPCW